MRKTICLTIAATVMWFCSAARAVSVGSTWQYTTVDPGRGWNMPGFQENKNCPWKSGKAGFGRVGKPADRVKTPWKTPDIWMRATYVLPKGLDLAKLSIEACHDEDFEFYINGVLAAGGAGHRNDYALFAINPTARKAIRPGENLIAVHCHQTTGGQFIDVGFTTKSMPRAMPKAGGRSARPVRVVRKIADTRYSRKASWSETMLAVRAAIHAAGLKLDMDMSSAVAGEFWRDFPRQTDWLMQDSPGEMDKWVAGYLDGKGDMLGFLTKDRNAGLERGLIAKALAECGAEAGRLGKEFDALVKDGAGADDGRWLGLYEKACLVRRQARLASLLSKTKQIVFARHHNMGGGFFAYTEYVNWKGNKYGGLFRLDLANEAAADGKFAETTALIRTDADGATIRDPELSYDAKRMLFAWRKGGADRYYKIYEMDLATGATRPITGGGDTYGASYDPVYLPDGNILFNSTRVIQSVDCAGPDVANLYVCDKDGKFARRVGFDQVHTLSPSVMDDGRVIYMRWDYNDRSQIYTQCLMQMNPDGTAQTEYYGNNTFEPTTFFHPRGIPGTSKVMVALGGHHNPQCGKLGVVDNSKGRQGTDGVIELPSGQKPTYRRADAYAQEGDMYKYPYPLDESTLLVSYDPIAYHLRERGVRGFSNKEHMRFHLYFMTFDGKRELLAADARISSCQPIPVIARKVPHVRPSSVDYRQRVGRFYMQDVYLGPGLEGIARGTIKKLRVVELRFREMSIGANSSRGAGGGARVITPVAVGTGSWDVKVILGDATVYEDGSAMFEAPARTPVYFQALNEKNQVIQTMRSWATLMPGESFSCVGCHENKNDTPKAMAKVALAMKAGPEKLKGFYGPPRGFSFPKEVQPILDRHCLKCHKPDARGKGRNYVLTGEEVLDKGAKRKWYRSYLTLTNTKPRDPGYFNQAQSNELVNWISNSSVPTMIPPRHGGSTRSKMISMLEKGHEKVKLSREEMDKLCAWIDLTIPFCGDSMEANAWNEGEFKKGAERMKLRREADQRDLDNIKAMLQATK